MYPISYEADLQPEPGRATTFFRLLLAIPWFIVAVVWSLLFSVTHLIAWVAVIILGRYPEWAYRFNSGVIRFSARLTGWLTLQTDEWPPFGIGDDPGYPIRLNIPEMPEERQSRLKAFFRYLLALPLIFVIGYGTGYIVWAAAFVAWLTIVFRGYMPEGVHKMLTYCNDLHLRATSYVALLTDDYPPIGLERGGSAPGPAQSAAPAPPEAPTQPAP